MARGIFNAERPLSEVYQDLFDLYPGPVILLDEKGAILQANTSASSLLEAWGVEQQLPSEWQQICQQVIRESRPFIEEVAAGEQTYLVHVKPLAERAVCCLVGQDVSPFKAAEHMLLQSSELLSSVLREAPLGVFVTDLEGFFTLFQGRLFAEHFVDALALIGSRLGDLVENKEEVMATWERALQGEASECVLEVLSPDSEMICYWNCWMYAQQNAEGVCEGVYGVVVDNTEEFLQQEKLQEFNKRLRGRIFHRTKQLLQANFSMTRGHLGAVEALVRLGEMHSPLLGGHARRVAKLAVGMGRQLGLSAKELQQVEVAALLHDIGKMRMPPELISKRPSEMKTQDRELYYRHPAMGEEVVRMLPQFEEAARAVRHHHENYDGSGFPDHLPGHHIPFFSRIIAVADAYDRALNMGSMIGRMNEETALIMLQGMVLKQFDPDAVWALMRHLRGEDVQQEEKKIKIPYLEVPIALLKAGMVLAQDVRDARNVMLVPADTKLSQKKITLLSDALRRRGGPKKIWIKRESIPLEILREIMRYTSHK